jgi:small GTP-binding protein
MVGDFAVGKTSLTQRFVNNSFSEKYLTTIGVKIDNVVIEDLKLIVWDVAGRDVLSSINTSYLAGAAGIIIVADGTRASTIDSVHDLAEQSYTKIGKVPTVVAINKKDEAEWDLAPSQESMFAKKDWPWFETSAKSGEKVSDLFAALAQRIR